MRDWTRAVVFGWVGSGSCGAAYRRLLLGRSTQKAWFIGWPPVNGHRGATARWRMPSHPPVRHYDRSELMKLTNLRCGKAIPGGIPSPHQGLPLPLSQRLERDEAWAKCGSLDRRIRAGGAARRSTQHSTSAKTAPPAPQGASRPQHPGAASRAGYQRFRPALTSPARPAPSPAPSGRA